MSNQSIEDAPRRAPAWLKPVFRLRFFTRLTFAIIAIAAAFVAYLGVFPDSAYFKLETASEIGQGLLGLFVAALLMERVQEVFVTAWRQGGRIIRDAELNKAAAAAVAKPQGQAEQDALKYAQFELEVYKSTTKSVAFGIGLIIGFLFALAGLRSLSEFMVYENLEGLQAVVFEFADILVTAGVIAGGSDAIHKLISVFTDGFDMTRKLLKNSAAAQVAGQSVTVTPPTE